MTQQFNKCLDFVLEKEGGYVNLLSDPGGGGFVALVYFIIKIFFAHQG